jgi:hypothetical protein
MLLVAPQTVGTAAPGPRSNFAPARGLAGKDAPRNGLAISNRVIRRRSQVEGSAARAGPDLKNKIGLSKRPLLYLNARIKTILNSNLIGWTMDERIARLRTHRNNINRYRGLLETKLTEIEKQYIERRLSEEQSAMEALVVPGHDWQFSLRA